jgi:hypothetical protein
VIIFLTISVLSYYVFGDDYTPELFILRNQTVNKSIVAATAYKVLMAVFFLVSSIGLCVYSEGL